VFGRRIAFFRLKSAAGNPQGYTVGSLANTTTTFLSRLYTSDGQVVKARAQSPTTFSCMTECWSGRETSERG